MRTTDYKRKISSLRKELQEKKIELDCLRREYANFMNNKVCEKYNIKVGDKVRITTSHVITECYYGGYVCDLSEAALVGFTILPDNKCGTRHFFVSGKITDIEKL